VPGDSRPGGEPEPGAAANLLRFSILVPAQQAEEARAALTDLCPAGWEEREHEGELELATYAGPEAEELLRHIFGEVRGAAVAPDWTERWRAFHHGARVGRLWVGPPWERPPAGVLAVVVDPGMAFGTGAHPTTKLCLQLLSGQRACSVVDLGCGSGVLAIAAVKLGFSPVIALDRDPVAVEATCANAGANGVDLEVRLANVCTDELPSADLGLANLDLAAIPLVAARFRGRRLIASGYPAGQAASVAGWRTARMCEEDGWTAELLERR
jgi:ribosomal protein L11 methyltransferase